MQEVKITQYNKLIVNYDTYEFSPSNYKNIAIIDPWYIDVTSAPDFVVDELNIFTLQQATTVVMQSQKELNNITDTIPIAEDTYSIHNHSIDVYNGTVVNIANSPSMTHEDLVKYVLTQIRNSASITTYPYYIRVNDYYATTKPSSATIDKNDAILFPYYADYDNATLGRLQCIPRIQTITTTYNYTQLKYNLPAHQVKGYYSKSGSTPKTIDIAAGSYTFTQYINKLYYATIGSYYSANISTYMYNYPYMPSRRQSGFDIGFYGIANSDGTNPYNDLYCKLHCMWPRQSAVHHITNMPANSRCLHVPEGNWTVDNLINAVNSNQADVFFNLVSTDKYIYIKSDTPFMINPVCKIITEDTDIAETFNTNHVLLRHPMNKHFTATITTGSGETYSEEGDFTPAEFLRWIDSKVGLKCHVHGSTMYAMYDNVNDTSISIQDNPFFTFQPSTNIVENLCGLHTFDLQITIPNAYKLVGKQNYPDYNPELNQYDYSSVNIDSNITTTLNTSNVVLTK